MTTVREYLEGRSPQGAADSALVVQGGGMRGVYSMGALTAIEDAGLRNAFGLVVGASAGAINAAYLLSGQAHAAVNVYVELLSNRRFINPLRAWRIVDIDYMVDQALKVDLPIDLKALTTSPTRLEVVLTDADSAEPFVVSNRDVGVDFYEVIRATAALPSLYNKRVALNGRSYVDGGASDAVPVVRAVDAGATRVVAVLTRAPGFRRTDKGLAFRLLGRAMARGQSPAIKTLIGREDVRFNEAMDLLEGVGSRAAALEQWSVWPSDLDKLVGRTTFDKAKLQACADMGREDMQATLSARHDGSTA